MSGKQSLYSQQQNPSTQVGAIECPQDGREGKQGTGTKLNTTTVLLKLTISTFLPFFYLAHRILTIVFLPPIAIGSSRHMPGGATLGVILVARVGI
jgi:hypothetical protein